ncbi:phenylacetate-CoA ligase [Actinopolyspora xinjiangensis]|uniref:Phenylacetate-CoA ligase n=1 Tax=Actinopolyspora xinjiangensis TaxID=405564 RepID=A0A1H0X1Y3_9ACTN|nr:phenylacetate--CoA ligase family protein [Actinopolyspora xinjiangensis]SDP96932.1 phenylacetate-CoA ligase [Actinopolyspora xinjiangensis]
MILSRTSGSLLGDTVVRDVEAEATTNDRIGPYLRRNDRAVRETPATQLRLLRKWKHDRQRLHARVGADPEQISEWQLEWVRKLVDFAYATIPFYRDLYSAAGFEPGAVVSWSDFEQLPVVSKQMLVEAEVGPQLSADPTRAHRLHSARTSGSSGLNLTIYQDDASVDYRAMLYMRHCELYLGDELASDDWRYGVYFAAERFTSLLGEYPFVTVSQETPTDLLLQHLSEVRPRLVLSFPSYLQRLAAENVALDQFGVVAVGTNSERSSREERQRYSEVFGVPVLDEYSSEELSLIAHECRDRRYHLVEDSAYLEVANPDDQGFGRLVGTSLGNFVMPFIRYEQGDVVRLEDRGTNACECGTTFRTIDSFRGREDEGLQDGPNRTVPSDVVLGLCDSTLVVAESNVRQYQIVQVAPDLVQLRVQLSDPTHGTDNPLIRGFTEGLPTLFEYAWVRVEVVETEDFDTLVSGKRRLIYVEPGARA